MDDVVKKGSDAKVCNHTEYQAQHYLTANQPSFPNWMVFFS